MNLVNPKDQGKRPMDPAGNRSQKDPNVQRPRTGGANPPGQDIDDAGNPEDDMRNEGGPQEPPKGGDYSRRDPND